jgi:hypothetical protein
MRTGRGGRGAWHEDGAAPWRPRACLLAMPEDEILQTTTPTNYEPIGEYDAENEELLRHARSRHMRSYSADAAPGARRHRSSNSQMARGICWPTAK